ncbi:MAG TPA: surface-adhesin E family protein [Geomonas sp.]|nr:surface-adhesin E family protein [Geomonas sp.]
MTRGAVLLLLLVFFPGAAIAGDSTWIYATANKFATAYYLDKVKCLEGDQVNVWLKVDLTRKGISHFKKHHATSTANFKYFVDNKTYDCRKRRSATYQLTTYTREGEVLEEAVWKESDVKWSKVPDDSNDDFIMEELCMVCSK